MNATPLVSLRACFCSPERRNPDSQQLPALGYTLQHRLPPVCGLRRRNQRLRGGAITGLQHLRHTGRQDISCRGVMCAVGTLSTHTAAQPRQGRTTAILICHNRSADGFPAFFSDYVVIRAKALLQLPARTACPWRHPDALHEAARLKVMGGRKPSRSKVVRPAPGCSGRSGADPVVIRAAGQASRRGQFSVTSRCAAMVSRSSKPSAVMNILRRGVCG